MSIFHVFQSTINILNEAHATPTFCCSAVLLFCFSAVLLFCCSSAANCFRHAVQSVQRHHSRSVQANPSCSFPAVPLIVSIVLRKRALLKMMLNAARWHNPEGWGYETSRTHLETSRAGSSAVFSKSNHARLYIRLYNITSFILSVRRCRTMLREETREYSADTMPRGDVTN